MNKYLKKLKWILLGIFIGGPHLLAWVIICEIFLS
jgi:hypothetical protein